MCSARSSPGRSACLICTGSSLTAKSQCNVSHHCSSYPSINGHVNGAFTLPEDLADMGVPAARAAASAMHDACAGTAHRLARTVALLRHRHAHRGRGAAIFHKLWAAVVQASRSSATGICFNISSARSVIRPNEARLASRCADVTCRRQSITCNVHEVIHIIVFV
jgi:hypothetical protein